VPHAIQVGHEDVGLILAGQAAQRPEMVAARDRRHDRSLLVAGDVLGVHHRPGEERGEVAALGGRGERLEDLPSPMDRPLDQVGGDESGVAGLVRARVALELDVEVRVPRAASTRVLSTSTRSGDTSSRRASLPFEQ
jgi:hypothetical protein